MRSVRWLVALLLCAWSTEGLAKKPKPPPPLPPEVVAAEQAFTDAYTAWYASYQRASASEAQQAVWALGDDGAAFQPRIDALRADEDAAMQRLTGFNQAHATAIQALDPAAIRAAAAKLGEDQRALDALAASVDALEAELAAAKAALPKTIALAQVGATDAMKLQRVFATAGWSKEGAAVGSMLTSGYAYENFDVARDGKTLNVYVIRPNASATGTGGASPASVVKQAGADTVFRYDAASDTYVEIRPGEGATPADARALMAEVVTP